MSGDDLAQDAGNLRVLDEFNNCRTDLVRMVDRQNALQHLAIGKVCRQRLHVFRRIFTPSQIQCLLFEVVNLSR